MSMFPASLRHTVLLMGGFAVSYGAMAPLPAFQIVTPAAAADLAVTLQAGSGSVLPLAGVAANVFAVDPKIAEVRSAGPQKIFIFGIAQGETTVTAVDADGAIIGNYRIRVMPSSYVADRVTHATQSDPASNVAVHTDRRGVKIDGNVKSASDAYQLIDSANSEIPKDQQLHGMVAMQDSIQVNLRVRIVEMSRQLVRELGVQWENVNALGTSAAIGVATASPLAAMTTAQSSLGFLSRFHIGGRPTTLETVIDALSSDQLIHSLAEPNLTTVSGQPASFIVGGEYPIPVSSYNNNISVSYKQYGISLAFIPTVIDSGKIVLHVKPEVSALTSQGAVTLSSSSGGITIPALTVRRADTTVELGSGQSFAIAGLLQDNTTTNGLGLPFFGDIPILGALFRSDSFQHNQSELVIIVTPYIVRPVDNQAQLHAPDDEWSPPNDLDRILLLRQNGRAPSAATPMHIVGDAGFVVE